MLKPVGSAGLAEAALNGPSLVIVGDKAVIALFVVYTFGPEYEKTGGLTIVMDIVAVPVRVAAAFVLVAVIV
jgi:hypothetical protein